jgi:hypothetical protein
MNSTVEAGESRRAAEFREAAIFDTVERPLWSNVEKSKVEKLTGIDQRPSAFDLQPTGDTAHNGLHITRLLSIV